MHDINEQMAIKALKYIKDIIQKKINKMQKTFIYIEIFGRVFDYRMISSLMIALHDINERDEHKNYVKNCVNSTQITFRR